MPDSTRGRVGHARHSRRARPSDGREARHQVNPRVLWHGHLWGGDRDPGHPAPVHLGHGKQPRACVRSTAPAPRRRRRAVGPAPTMTYPPTVSYGPVGSASPVRSREVIEVEQALDLGRARHRPGRTGRGVVLVVDLADELLDQVLERHDRRPFRRTRRPRARGDRLPAASRTAPRSTRLLPGSRCSSRASVADGRRGRRRLAGPADRAGARSRPRRPGRSRSPGTGSAGSRAASRAASATLSAASRNTTSVRGTISSRTCRSPAASTSSMSWRSSGRARCCGRPARAARPRRGEPIRPVGAGDSPSRRLRRQCGPVAGRSIGVFALRPACGQGARCHGRCRHRAWFSDSG